MRSRSTKILINASGGLLALCLLFFACAPALAGNNSTESAATSVAEASVLTKDTVNYMPVSASEVGGGYAWSGPEFEKLKINPSHQYLWLQPGTEKNFTVSLENKDNKIINLKPKSIIIPHTENFVDENWISITPSEKALAPGEKVEFEVKVRVPENTDLGSYALILAFSEKVPEENFEAFYNIPGTTNLNFEVYVPASVKIMTSHITDMVEAGKSYEYEIELKNTGKEDIAISPEFSEDDYGPTYAYDFEGEEEVLGPEAFSIEAPDKVKAGETAVVKLKLKVPAGAKGNYNGMFDLNIEDPGIREYEGNVYLNFRILPSPEEPYVSTFYTSTNGFITIDLQSTLYDYGLYRAGKQSPLNPSFTVSLKDPSGKTIEPVLAGNKYSSSVRIDADSNMNPYPVSYSMPFMMKDCGLAVSSRSESDSYQSEATTYSETYTVPGTVGEWTLSILPINMESFVYSIEIEPAEE